jgi:hypothetical protein
MVSAVAAFREILLHSGERPRSNDYHDQVENAYNSYV